MKTLILLLVAVAVAVQAKPAPAELDAELIDMLRGMLTKGDHSLTTRGRGKADKMGDKSQGKGSEEKTQGKGSEEKEDHGLETTMLYGLPIQEFVKPRELTKEEVEWILSALKMEDLEALKGTLEKAGDDAAAIASGFVSTFANSAITELSEVKPALEKFYTDVILPKDVDMEGLKEWVEGLIIRGVISGTAIDALNDVEGKNYNEKGCRSDKDKDGVKQLGCILGKMKFLEVAIETRQMMTFGALYDERFGEPLAFCDSVFKLAESAATDPSVFTGANVVKALAEMGQCIINNVVKIDTRLNADAVGADGKPQIPNLPLPRLLALSAKMEQIEFQGWAGYMSFMVLEHIFEAMENGNAAGEAPVPATMPEAKKELADTLRELLEEVRSKAKRNQMY